MAKVLTLSQALKVWVWAIVAVAAAIASALGSDALIHSEHPSPATRWLAVVLATISSIPPLGAVLWGYSVVDEFWRRIVLVGTAIAFISSTLLYTAFAVMRDVSLIGRDEFIPYLPAAAIIWLISVGLTAVYYRMRL